MAFSVNGEGAWRSKNPFSVFGGKARVQMPSIDDMKREAKPERSGPVNDGRTMRRTGRDVSFATIATPDGFSGSYGPGNAVNGHLVVEHGAGADAPRDSGINFKATAETAALVAAIAKARGMSRAELLEDVVAGQVEAEALEEIFGENGELPALALH